MTEVANERKNVRSFIESLAKEAQTCTLKTEHCELLMQLWEGNSKGKLLIKRVIDTILAKTSFWACIILLEKPEMDYSTSSL